MLSVAKVACGLRPMERLMTSHVKPPNILIYTSDKKVFQGCRTLFESVLEPDCYAVYQLDEFSFRTNKAWLNNTSLLVLASQWTDKNLPLEEYVSLGGKCLSLHPIAVKWNGTRESDNIMKFVLDKGVVVSPVDKIDFAQDLPVLLERYFKMKVMAKSQMLPNDESSQMIGYLIAEPYHQEAFFRNFGQQSLSDSITLQLTKSFSSNDQDPVAIIRRIPNSRFGHRHYFEMLKTKVLGRTALYFDVVGSTHSILESCDSFPNGLVVIARRQTQGRGRKGNVWISAEGCAMFSLRMCFPLNSELGRHLSLLQHIVALAIVLAVKKQTHCQVLPLGIKWPNDIYIHHPTSSGSAGSIKVGGVLVTTSIMGSQVIAAIGCGVNLSNKRPTLCLNELIGHFKGTRPILLEDFIATVLNQLEELVDLISSGHLNQVIETYHKNWLHEGAIVTIRTINDEIVSAQILGIDEFGFLKVQPREGSSVTVHPDGNSFDMLSGLVTPKLMR